MTPLGRGLGGALLCRTGLTGMAPYAGGTFLNVEELELEISVLCAEYGLAFSDTPLPLPPLGKAVCGRCRRERAAPRSLAVLGRPKDQG